MIELSYTLNEYSRMCNTDTCRWCGEILTGNVDVYSHSDGWRVVGYTEKQWLSRHCSKCNYDWSLNKLGVPRE